MKPFSSIFGSIVIVIVIVFLLFALVIVLINLADKYREKEGEHERTDIIPIQPKDKSATSLMLTNDRTFFGRIPEGCEAFALAENESCYINTSKGKRELPLNSDLAIIRTGVDGVPFLEKVEYLRFSLLTRGGPSRSNRILAACSKYSNDRRMQMEGILCYGPWRRARNATLFHKAKKS